MTDLTSLEDLRKLIDSKGEKVKPEINVLCLDISSSCTGYALCSISFETRTGALKEAGSLWLPDMEQADKCNYMYNAFINYFNVLKRVDYVTLESYFANPNKGCGVLVTPEIVGALKASFSECGIKFSTMPPQSWRAALGIKKDANKKYKEPTKAKVLEFVKVPERIINNVTKKERQTSSDLYDAVALAIAWTRKIGIRQLDFSKVEFQGHVGNL